MYGNQEVEESYGFFLCFFCKAQAMIAERKILLCKLLSSGESETIEIKPCSTIVYILGVSGKRFRQLTEK